MIVAFLLKNWRAILFAVVIGGLLSAVGVQTARLNSTKTEFAEWRERAAEAKTAREKQRADDERYARAVEGRLRDTAAAIQKDSDEKERVLNARVASLRDELRNRPQRPAAGSQAAAAGTPAAGATGAGLYREDGEFLAGEAAAAAHVGEERDECRAQYLSAEEALKKYQAGQAAK